jgi:hypothetical protein
VSLGERGEAEVLGERALADAGLASKDDVMLGVTPEEAKRIVAWVRKHRRGRQGRRPRR